MSLYKWRLTCSVHGDIYIWSEQKPTACNVNATDTINDSFTKIVDSISTGIVTVKEEDTPTQGYFRTITKVMNVVPGLNTFEYTWPYPISVSCIFFTSKSEHEGDVIEMIPAHKTTVAALISVSDKVITVSSSTYFKLGFYVYINDQEGGEVTHINGNQITLSNAILASPGSLVKVSRKAIDNYTIGPAFRYDIGSSKIGASYVPANTVITVTYDNKSEVAKKFVTQIEYLY